MKTIILGICSVVITIYSVLLCLDVYSIQTSKNILEKRVTRAVQNTLEQYYRKDTYENAKNQLNSEILMGGNKENISIHIKKMDLKKGVLSVVVEEMIPLITGGEKSIVFEKTAIMERRSISSSSLLGGE